MAIIMPARDKISKAKLRLYSSQPFFSYLVEHLRFIEDTQKTQTIGVTRKAECFYNPEFISKISHEEMLGVLCHEVMHLAYKHPERGQGRNILLGNMSLWNIAIDIVVNNLLVLNNFSLPSEGIIPRNDTLDIFGISVTEISKKSAEDIYEIIKDAVKDQLSKQPQSGESGNGTPLSDPENEMGFDDHFFEKTDGQDSGVGDEPKEKNWDHIVQTARNFSKMRGKEPSNLGREFDIYQRGFINWKNIITRLVSRMVPRNYCWSRPDRRLIPFDIYLPHITGETSKVLISIDTSGSISRDELSLFFTEIVHLAKSFDGIEIRIITHDSEVHDDYHVFNGSIEKIMNIAPHGGGGTDHVPLYNYIEAKKYTRGNSLLISMTDGCSNYPERPNIPTVFVLAGMYSKASIPGWNSGIVELLGDKA